MAVPEYEMPRERTDKAIERVRAEDTPRPATILRALEALRDEIRGLIKPKDEQR